MIPLSATPKLVAHRGYQKKFPENTLAAMRGAAEAGAAFVECDLQLTRDLEPVLLHDPTLSRVCGEAGVVFDHRWKQLKVLRASEQDRLGLAFVDEPIAHLSDFVDFLQAHPNIRAFVEMKEESIAAWGLDSVFERVLQVLAPGSSQVTMISFSYNWCERVRKASDYPVGYIARRWEEGFEARVKNLGLEFFCIDWQCLPAGGELKGSAAELFAWEIDNPKLALKLHQRGLGFVETFEIGEMIQAFER